MIRRRLGGAIASASAALDRRALRAMEHAMRPSGGPPEDARMRLNRLADLYGNADTLADRSSFFAPPANAEFTEQALGERLGANVVDLAYPSTYRAFADDYRGAHADYTANLTCHARWYRHREPRPVAICLHGWGGGAYWLEERVFAVGYLLRLGLDVVLFQLPFHGQRAPRQGARSGALFPSANVMRTNEGFGQAISDLRALAYALRERGAPEVGVVGMSLGGYTAALWASLDGELAFAAPMIPAVSMAELMWRHGTGGPTVRRAERNGVSLDQLVRAFAVHAPLTRPVKVARERLLIVAGRGDRITGPDQAESLWRHWQEPELVWFDGGHLAQVGRGAGFRALRAMLERAGLTAPA